MSKDISMRKMTVVALAVLVAALVAGCDTDCAKPGNEQKRAECAHKASTEPRGPDTLPSNPKKW